LLTNVAPAFNAFLRALALLFGLSVIVHFISLIPLFLTHKFLAKLLHMDIS